jgi:hypothetical protein
MAGVRAARCGRRSRRRARTSALPKRVPASMASCSIGSRSPTASQRASRVSASDDLVDWQTLVAQAGIADLRQGQYALVRRRIELPGVPSRYLLLERLDDGAPLELVRFTATSAPRHAPNAPPAPVDRRTGAPRGECGRIPVRSAWTAGRSSASR